MTSLLDCPLFLGSSGESRRVFVGIDLFLIVLALELESVIGVHESVRILPGTLFSSEEARCPEIEIIFLSSCGVAGVIVSLASRDQQVVVCGEIYKVFTKQR